MHRYDDSKRDSWLLIPVDPAFVASFRRWNIVISSALSFIVLGVFAMAFAPHPGHAASATHGALFSVTKRVENLTPAMAQELSIPKDTRGVLVTSVDPHSAAAIAGLQGGDVIEEVNRAPVRDVNEFRHALRDIHDHSVRLLINREGFTEVVVVHPQ